MDRIPWTDDSVFAWGEHKGKRIADCPPSYLLWLLKQRWIVSWPGLHAWLKANAERLKALGGVPSDQEQPPPEFGTYEEYLKDYRGY